jgi:hypothetical protein
MEDRAMVRTIIQLSEAQSRALKERAKEQGVSVSELARQGIDLVLSTRIGDSEAKRRALAAVGYASSGDTDVSEHHDDYLARAYKQ